MNRLEDVIKTIKERIMPLSPVNKSLKEAYGCVLAEDAYASMDQPPFPRSPLDGYALKAFDSAGASKDRPAILKIVDDSFAGSPAKAFLEDGCTVRIMTGGRIPDGADCVIRQENVDVEKDMLKIYQQLERFENYCHRGEDYQAGQLLAAKGSRLDAASVAVLASSGFINVQCVPKARAAILSTGDELRRPGSPLPMGCIYDSNEYYIHARMKDYGIDCRCMDPAEDSMSNLILKIEEALENTDLLITTGGVSVGEKDLMPNALRAMGAEVIFEGISVKPGMPTMAAVLDNKVILALSGNPFAAAVCFELLIKDVLNAMYGSDIYKSVRKTAMLKNDFNKSSKIRRFIRGIYDNGEVFIPAAQGNGQLSSMVGCNCLVEIPEGSNPLVKGETVVVSML